MTSAIHCPHGQLRPGKGTKASSPLVCTLQVVCAFEQLTINKAIWDKLVAIYPSKVLPSQMEDCPVCEQVGPSSFVFDFQRSCCCQESNESSAEAKELKARMNAENKKAGGLLKCEFRWLQCSS